MTDKKSMIAYGLIAMTVIFVCALIFVPSLLIPAGYSLAIDGYVISRTLCILFIAHWALKIGLILLEKK